MNLLLAIADRSECARLRRALEARRHRVLVTRDVDHAYGAATTQMHDALLVDARLGGAALCNRLRHSDVMAPNLMFADTGKSREAVALLDGGADDVVSRSIAVSELEARVKAVGRRIISGNEGLQIGTLRLDESRHGVVRGTDLIPLTAKEFSLLQYLMRRRGQVLTREEIRSAVWADGREHERDKVDLCIHYLRNKIERPGEPDYIKTVRHVGYVFAAEGDRA